MFVERKTDLSSALVALIVGILLVAAAIGPAAAEVQASWTGTSGVLEFTYDDGVVRPPYGSVRAGAGGTVDGFDRTPSIQPIRLIGHTYDHSASFVAPRTGQYVDVLDPVDRHHILFGDGPGSGGHLWPGADPSKSPFPQAWGPDQIIHNVGDIVTDPNTVWRVQTGSGGLTTKAGDPAVWRAWEVRDGVRMRVAYEPLTGRVRTAFPDTSPATGAVIE